MVDISRRSLLQVGAALGFAGAGSSSAAAKQMEMEMNGSAYEDHTSPELEKYVHEVPIPEERTADGWRRGAAYHDIAVEEAQHTFHPDLGETTIWGFDGQFPGPILSARTGQRLAVEFDNSGLPDEHLFTVDETLEGTTSENYVGYDGPVPEVRTVTHVHGLQVDPANDGQAEMWTAPDGTTGPRFAGPVQELPNRQSRLTTAYHDHARGISRLNNYAGLVGPYRIRSWQEEWLNLPDGDYDVPLVLADRSFTDDGELFYPDTFVANVAGDTPTVNGAAWPYMEVEPRKYRFHILNVSNGRTYDLGLTEGAADDGGHDGDDGDGHHDDVPTLHQISAGHGFLEEVVPIGPHGDLESLVLAPFERAEVVVDFSDYAGETVTVTNDAAFPYEGGDDGHGNHDGGTEMDMDPDDGGEMGHDDGMGHEDGGMDHDDGGMDHGNTDHPQIHEIMQFRVAEEVRQPDTSTHPTGLSLPNRAGPDPDDARTIREVTMGMGMDDDGRMIHTLNGNRWGDPVEFEPQLGSTEVWELVNDDHHTHPIHLHLVNFEVIERERHDTDHGPQPPRPNERGSKDVVRVDPGETVRIAVEFDGFTGKYPFHCHILEHEEHDMMRPFEVVEGDSDEQDGDGGGHPDNGRDWDRGPDWGDGRGSGWGNGHGSGWGRDRKRGQGWGRGRRRGRGWGRSPGRGVGRGPRWGRR